MRRRRVAITGAGGQLGGELVRAFGEAGDEVLALVRPEFDIMRAADLERLTAWRPDVVVNSAAWTDVDACARDPERALRINGEAAGAVAEAAAAAGALIVQISTNEVFDGELDRPYTEDDEPKPINPYGASKLAGERAVAAASPRHLIVRTAWLFGPGGNNFVTKILAAAQQAHAAGEPLRVVADEWGNQTWTPSLADAIVTALSRPEVASNALKVVHLAGDPACSRLIWAVAIVEASGRAIELQSLAHDQFARASNPPTRAVLRTSEPSGLADLGLEWRSATQDYVRSILAGNL